MFAIELCSRQRIRFSLSNLCGPQRIRCSLPPLRCSQKIRFLLLNSVNCSNSGFCCQIFLTVAIQVFTVQICVVSSEIVLSVGNQVFAAECVVRNKSGFRCRICVVRSESGVCCAIVLFTANHVFVVFFFLIKCKKYIKSKRARQACNTSWKPAVNKVYT